MDSWIEDFTLRHEAAINNLENEKQLKELQAQKDAALAKQQADQAAAKKALLAPDKEKIQQLAIALKEYALPGVTSDEAKAIIANVRNLLDKVVTFINSQSDKL